MGGCRWSATGASRGDKISTLCSGARLAMPGAARAAVLAPKLSRPTGCYRKKKIRSRIARINSTIKVNTSMRSLLWGAVYRTSPSRQDVDELRAQSGNLAGRVRRPTPRFVGIRAGSADRTHNCALLRSPTEQTSEQARPILLPTLHEHSDDCLIGFVIGDCWPEASLLARATGMLLGIVKKALA